MPGSTNVSDLASIKALFFPLATFQLKQKYFLFEMKLTASHIRLEMNQKLRKIYIQLHLFREVFKVQGPHISLGFRQQGPIFQSF